MDVKSIRKKLKLSRKELADKLGISKRTVEAWEQRRRAPDEENAEKLAELFKEVYHG